MIDHKQRDGASSLGNAPVFAVTVHGAHGKGDPETAAVRNIFFEGLVGFGGNLERDRFGAGNAASEKTLRRRPGARVCNLPSEQRPATASSIPSTRNSNRWTKEKKTGGPVPVRVPRSRRGPWHRSPGPARPLRFRRH